MTNPRTELSGPTLEAAPGGTGQVSVWRKTVLETTYDAAPIGPYSQGIKVGNLIFVDGEKGVDVRTGKVVSGGVGAETRQTMENVKAILEQPRSISLRPPGRITVQEGAIPAGARVEITVVAVVA